jgi:DNA polymerase-3 subunit alpha
MYYKPRIDKELLRDHASGLIGMSGCLKGRDQLGLARGSVSEGAGAGGAVSRHPRCGEFLLEMQDHGIEQQIKVNRVLPRIASDLGLGLVGANDVHFLERGQHEAHDVMICIGTGSNVTDEKRMKYVPELYFKSPAEMAHIFRDHPEAVTNTLAIAERCNLDIEFGVPKEPNYTPPEGMTRNEYLRQIAEEGVRRATRRTPTHRKSVSDWSGRSPCWRSRAS